MRKLFVGIFISVLTVSAFAQDKALLETLVKKGMLTQQEATQIAKASVIVTPEAKATKSIKVTGGMQGWFKWAGSDVSSGSASIDDVSGFELRYIKVGMEADIGSGWSANIVMDFGSEASKRNYLDRVVVAKKVDIEYIDGKIEIGLRKSNMGVEQITDDFGLLAISRSVSTDFFTSPNHAQLGEKNFGGRTVGVFWDGEISQIEGLYYSVAVTSETTEGSKDIINNISADSGLSYYVAVGYKNVIELEGETLSYNIGVNSGYASKGFKNIANSKGEVYGLNPYLKLKYGGFTAMAEMFYQSVEKSNAANKTASPLGVNAIVAYKFDLDDTMGAIEPVARFSYVTSGGLGVNSIKKDDGTYATFNQAKAVYVGINWYTTKSIKTSLGYEYAMYTSGTDAAYKEVDNNTVLAQLQVVF